MWRLLFFLFAAGASGATYYIAPTGGSDSNAGTEGAPWATFNKVKNTIASGDTVIARGGVYSGQQWWSGVTPKTNLTFLAYTGEVPIIANYSNSSAALFINAGYDYSLIRGFVFSNNYNAVNVQYAVRLTFDGCSFGWYPNTNSYPWGHGLYANVAVWRAQYTVFTNCLFYDWGIVGSNGDDHGAPLALGGFSDIYDTNCYGTVVTDCRFVHGGHDNIEIYTRSNVIRRCVFYNPRYYPGYPFAGVYYGNRNVSALGGSSSRNLFEDNLLAATGLPSDDDEVSGIELSSPFHIVRRNRFYQQAGPAIELYAKGFGVGASNNYIYANTAVMSAMDSSLVANDLVAVRVPHSTSISNRWVNNAFSWVGETNDKPVYLFFVAATYSNQTRFSSNYDNIGNALLVNTNWAGITSTMPLASASDYNTPNLRPTRASPLVDAGAWLTTIESASGSGTSIVVNDAGYFYDGWGIPGEVGDLIQLHGRGAQVRITAVNYDTRVLALDTSITWTNGQGVSLAYSGSQPDIGAYEYPNPKSSISGGMTFSGNVDLR